jgi:predicted amidohydrolase
MSELLIITGIQTDLHWENKQANLDLFEKKISSISQPTEIVVLPEMFSTGFSMNPESLAETMDGQTVQWMKKMAAKKKIILTGSVIIKDQLPPPSEGDRGRLGGEVYFNRLIWMLPNGEFGYYDKRHLFAYADEDQHYTPGNKRLIASVKGWKIHLLICYDLRFPIWSRQSSGNEMEFDVLIYVANWPERRAHAWKTLLQARAIENQCYVVGVNRVGDDGNKIHYSGESMAVDPMGEVLYTRKDEEDIFTVKLDKQHLENVRSKLPFWKDADRFRILD